MTTTTTPTAVGPYAIVQRDYAAGTSRVVDYASTLTDAYGSQDHHQRLSVSCGETATTYHVTTVYRLARSTERASAVRSAVRRSARRTH